MITVKLESGIRRWLSDIREKYAIQAEIDFELCFMKSENEPEKELAQKALRELGLEHQKINFPNECISLSHSKNHVVVVRINGFKGVGIDIQFKKPQEKSSKSKLLKRIAFKDLKKSTEEDVLKVWTIKEALFKANMQNKNTYLSEYKLIDNTCAEFEKDGMKVRFEYICFDFDEFLLSCAVLP